ncbi:MAG: pyruvate kinase [Candidatus Competibacterales bacterium]
MRRHRHAKILATLGPASSDEETIHTLFHAGADVFRLNFSHGSHDDHRRRFEIIRALEAQVYKPIGVLLDLQGPKLRIGRFETGPITLTPGQAFRLDLSDIPGDGQRVQLPHPEILDALRPGAQLLLNDGKLRLKVVHAAPDFADTEVVVGGELSDRNGVNVPDVVIPLSPLTPKDREDLDFGLSLGADWIALSFVQHPSDIDEIKGIIQGRAAVMAKLEKPAAIDNLEAIVERADAVMVARGDLGVELPPEDVPGVQKRIIRACRQAGKPVVVATQMLESMIQAPTPTRAEASDVATAVYEGADAVMLSAETAAGQYPREAVAMMNRIIARVERDERYRDLMDSLVLEREPTAAAAVCSALNSVSRVLQLATTVTYTSSGSTCLRAARERPEAPIVALTPHRTTARRLTVVWGVHPAHCAAVESVTEMVNDACRTVLQEGFARRGDTIAITAGMPFGTSGTTNLLRIATLE